MANLNNGSSSRNIPKLDDTNYTSWLMRMKENLRHKGLLKYVLEPPTQFIGAVAEAFNKKLAETVDTLMNYMSATAFDAIITPANEEDPYAIWMKIQSRYASTSVNNKGRIWLRFMRYEFSGNLRVFIDNVAKMLNEIAVVKMKVPDDVLCYSILAKLSEEMHNIVDNIMMNDSLIANPEATLGKLREQMYLEESRKTKVNQPTKIKTDPVPDGAAALIHESKEKRKKKVFSYRCSPEQHNPKATSHTANTCYQLHPHLHPSFHKQPSTQLVEAKGSLFLTEEATKPVVLDSGATHHMINDPTVFKIERNTDMKILTGGHQNHLVATAVGSVRILNHLGQGLTLEHALLVPSLSQSLISLLKLFSRTFNISKVKYKAVKIIIDNNMIFNGCLKNNLLELSNVVFDAMHPSISCYHTSPDCIDWHSRLGHPHPSYQLALVPNSIISKCEIRTLCKLQNVSFKSHFKEVGSILQAVHVDLVGPFPVQSNSGCSYFLSITDQFSGQKVVKFLRNKHNAFKQFHEFKKEAEKQTSHHLRIIVSDSGGEFINSNFKNICASEGIKHHVSPPYTPQNNGLAKRSNQTILVKARCLHAQAKLPKSFWAE